MAAHLRIYTINRGEMDAWLKQFDRAVPVMAKAGMTVTSRWVNAADNEFIWVREYRDGDIEGCDKAFTSSPEWKVIGDEVTSHIAKYDIRLIEPA